MRLQDEAAVDTHRALAYRRALDPRRDARRHHGTTQGMIMSKTGQFVWRETASTNVGKSAAFYKALFGWTLKEVPMGDFSYSLAHVGEKQVGGMMPLPKMAEGVPSYWMSYVAVEDVDATAVKCTEAGGKILMPATDIPNLGRFAILQDPTGAAVTAWKSKTGDGEPQMVAPGVGEFCWEQLNTNAPAAATAFYAKVFGWTSRPFAEGSDISVYCAAGDKTIASMMAAPPGVPSHWLTYVVVAKLVDANAKVKELGGQVLMPEISVPGMGVISIVQDPAGAAIGLFEGRM